MKGNMATVTSIEDKTTSTNKPYKLCSLADGRKVSVWSDHPLFSEVAPNFEIPDSLFYQKGQYWNLTNPARKGAPRSGGYQNKRTADIKEAQDNKERSITFFNSTNAAMQAVSTFNKADFGDKSTTDIRKEIREWRDWFIKEHDNYKNHKDRYPEEDPLQNDAPELDESMTPKDW